MTLRFQSCATFRSRPSMFFTRTAPAGGRALAFLLEASIRHARPPYPRATDTVCQTVFKVVLPPDLGNVAGFDDVVAREKVSL